MRSLAQKPDTEFDINVLVFAVLKMIYPLEKAHKSCYTEVREKAAACNRDGRAEMPSQNHLMNDGCWNKQLKAARFP